MRARFLTLPLLTLLSAPLPGLADVFPLNTPSGNITCSVGTGETSTDIACAIAEKEGVPPLPRPASCAGPWGHRYEMFDHGPVKGTCGPGYKETKPEMNAMPYGATADFGGIACSSSKQGLECRNSDGHGFFLSRRSQRVY